MKVKFTYFRRMPKNIFSFELSSGCFSTIVDSITAVEGVMSVASSDTACCYQSFVVVQQRGLEGLVDIGAFVAASSAWCCAYRFGIR